MKILSKLCIINMILLINFFSFYEIVWAEDGFTEKDRNVLLRLQVKMEEIDKRFDQVDKRFDQVDIRFEELREDMNKRFEQFDKRFEDMLNFLYILAGIFSTMVVGVIGFAYWDRRTILYKSREEVREITKKDREMIKENQRHIEEHKLQLDNLRLSLKRILFKLPDSKELLSEI
ncbi:conserved hypothetical protein [Candidatus Magnetomoraceae bacterium gMMP-15]